MALRNNLIFLFLFLIQNFYSYCQNHDWWANNVGWDGRTHWSRYIILSPKYMGPNGLTVPAINNGSIDSLSSLGLTAHFHFSKGDNTQNAVISGNYASRNNNISVDAQFIPYEHFQLSHEWKTERKTFYEHYYKTNVTGDVIVNTTVQLFQQKREKFQLALRLGVRMPSGGGFTIARYGDVPAYWIDAGAGIPLRNKQWKLVGSVGFFVWQINHDQHRQNDAPMYSVGVEWNRRNLICQAYLAGYSGYLYNGDQPLVARVNFEKKHAKKIWVLRLQHGLYDFSYSSVEIGGRLILGN